MRYGMMNFPVKPVLEEIQRAASLAMDYVELAMDPPCAHFSGLRRNQKAIGRALRDHGLELTCHLPTFVYTAHLCDAIRQASVQEMTASVETAVDLGARKAVVHPGYIDGLAVYVPDEALRLAMDSLDRIQQRASQLGIVLCVENMFPGLGPFAQPDQFEALFDSFPALSLALDVGHAHIGDATGTRCVDFITRFSRRLAHLHVSDNRGQSDEHLPIGRGTVPFDAIAAALRAVGYDDSVTLEIFGQQDAVLAASRQAWESLFEVAATASRSKHATAEKR